MITYQSQISSTSNNSNGSASGKSNGLDQPYQVLDEVNTTPKVQLGGGDDDKEPNCDDDAFSGDCNDNEDDNQDHGNDDDDEEEKVEH